MWVRRGGSRKKKSEGAAKGEEHGGPDEKRSPVEGDKVLDGRLFQLKSAPSDDRQVRKKVSDDSVKKNQHRNGKQPGSRATSSTVSRATISATGTGDAVTKTDTEVLD